MLPAAERLAEMLNTITFNKPQIPVINNVDVATLTDSAAIKDALVRQLHSPVRWVETIEAMNTDKIDTLIECGPGKVLAGLVKRIAPQISCPTTHDLKSLQGVIDGRA
jgi:[acyl-carrier-protein] S-malonyltransferase